MGKIDAYSMTVTERGKAELFIANWFPVGTYLRKNGVLPKNNYTMKTYFLFKK